MAWMLIANIILDDFDKELEFRGHRFVRYTDDAVIFVKSKRAAAQVLVLLFYFS